MTTSERPTARQLKIVREKYGTSVLGSGPRDKPYDFTEEETLRGIIHELLDEIDRLRTERAGWTPDEVALALSELVDAGVPANLVVENALVATLRFAVSGKVATTDGT